MEIIKTYHNALARGDGSVYLIDGRTLMIAKDDGTVDGCHPMIWAFSMAGALKRCWRGMPR